MRFTSIDGKPIAEQSFPTLLSFFVEHAFYEFMNSGRTGIEQAAAVIVYSLEAYICSSKFANVGTQTLTDAQFLTIKHHLAREMIDGFIKRGSEGFDPAIRNVYQALIDTLRQNRAAEQRSDVYSFGEQS